MYGVLKEKTTVDENIVEGVRELMAQLKKGIRSISSSASNKQLQVSVATSNGILTVFIVGELYSQYELHYFEDNISSVSAAISGIHWLHCCSQYTGKVKDTGCCAWRQRYVHLLLVLHDTQLIITLRGLLGLHSTHS